MRELVLTILLIVAGASFAQESVISLDVGTKDDDTGKRLSGATVEIRVGGKVFTTKTSASNGKVPIIELPLGQTYTIIIKKSGYVPKVATLDARFDYPEDLPPFVPFKFETSLFRDVEGVDFSWMETTPLIKFEMNQYGQQTWDDAYTKEMLKKIEKLKKEIEEKREAEEKKRQDFDDFVATADKAFDKKEYKEAIDNYDKALALFDEPDVKKRRDEAQKALDALNAAEETEKKFQEKMQAAQEAYDNKKYESAISLYKEASTIKPDENLPKERVKEIEEILKNQKAKEEEFKKFVAAGDAAMGSKDFDKAITDYEAALAIKEDAGVKTKLEEAKKKKQDKLDAEAAAKELEEKYANLIAEADKAFDSKSYEEAKKKYTEALALKKESHPTQRIAEIDEILKKKKEEEEAAKKLEEDYNRLIKEGDDAFSNQNWDQAIAKFEEALKLKPQEKHPADQIKLAKEKKANAEAEAAINEKYNKLISEAEGLKSAEKYKEAITKYKEAQQVKPSEKEPAERIAEIEAILKDLEASKEREAKYVAFMKEGQDAQNSENLELALEKYQKALEVKSGDAAAQKKIDEVKKLIADKKAAEEKEQKFKEFVATAEKAFDSKDYTSAKMNYQKALDIKDDAGVREKIKEIDKLIAESQNKEQQQAKYDAAIKEADQAFNAANWEKALEKYQEAYAVKEENHPKERIVIVKQKIAELEEKEAKEKQFNDLVAQGDGLSDKGDFSGAIEKYKAAIAIKPDPSVSKKILDLEQKLKEQAKNQELMERYNKKIAEADAAFDSKNWNEAKKLYQEALDIKSNEQHPKDRLAEIEKRIKEESQNEVEAEYQKIINEADKFKGEEKFDDAISSYEKAIQLKPNDPYPKKQIEAIKKIISDRENQEAEKEAFEKKYKELITSADKAFTEKKYQEALGSYKEAAGMKPNETHPKSRIEEINKLLEKLNEKEAEGAEYEAAISKANSLFNEGKWKEAKTAYEKALTIKPAEQHPKDQIELCNQKMQAESVGEEEEQYQKILTVAQKKLDQQDYEKALELYERAKGIRPGDPIPQQRIDEINQLLKDLDKEKEKRDKYKRLIQEADTFYERKKWKQAMEKYMDALDLYRESYPEEQLEKCREFLKNTGDTADKQYNKLIEKADEYFHAANYTKAIELYKRAIKLKPSDQYPKDQLREIDLILNPPKNDQKIVLNDYGPNVNEDPVDLEKMLREAKDEAEYIEVKRIYEAREEAMEAQREWSESATEETFKAKDEIEEVELSIKEMKWTGEQGRQEAIEKTEEWRQEIIEEETERVKYHENDIHFQNKKLEAIKTEISQNEVDNDKSREQFIMDVEEIKLEIKHKTGDDARDQTNETFENKSEIDHLVETHVTNDPQNDDQRKKVVDDVEEMRTEVIDKEKENVMSQQDEIMKAKDQTEIMVDNIQANEMDNDEARQEYVLKVEQIEESIERKEGDRMKNQIDKNQESKDEIEELVLEIEESKKENDEPRKEMEDFVVETKDHLQDVNTKRATDQTDEIMSNKDAIEEIELDIEEHKKEMDKDREGYEEVVEKTREEISEYDGELADKNKDKSFETKAHTESMEDKQAEFLKGADENAEKQADEVKDAVEEHIDHIGENEKENEEARQENMDYVEEMKNIDPKKINVEMENELGEKYPEGVTEETFAINDNNGLMKAYVIRRVVVRDGVGKLYEKIQTRYGQVTYTKNGHPISEYMWSDETSAAAKN
ncbi:MAG: hypothetical protein WDZ35_03970 [Crocinitomicaceae bacterium]